MEEKKGQSEMSEWAMQLQDMQWMKHVLKLPDLSKVENSTMVQGMSGARLTKVSCLDENDQSLLVLVFKESAGGAVAQGTGIIREVNFYNDLGRMGSGDASCAVGIRVPRVYYAVADENTAAKAILMEDLGHAIQSGFFFDPAQPNNLGKDVAGLTAPSDMTTLRVATGTFLAAATLHGRFWNKAELRDPKNVYLRGSKWTEQSWTAGVNVSTGAMKNPIVAEFFARPEYSLLSSLLERSHTLTTWSNYQGSPPKHFTLVHGDFHPGNMLILPQNSEFPLSDEQRVCFLDWEMVGLGSGPQELGQYLISHATSEWRREHERDLVQLYFEALVPHLAKQGISDYTFVECWNEYVHGGLAKWLWFMPLLASMCPVSMTDYFAGKVTDFAVDHEVTPATVQMLRFA